MSNLTTSIKKNFQKSSLSHSNYENYILINNNPQQKIATSPFKLHLGKNSGIPQSFSLYSSASVLVSQNSKNLPFPVDPVKDYGFFLPNSTITTNNNLKKSTTIFKLPYDVNEKCVINTTLADSVFSSEIHMTNSSDESIELPQQKIALDVEWPIRNNSTPSTSSAFSSTSTTNSTCSSNTSNFLIKQRQPFNLISTINKHQKTAIKNPSKLSGKKKNRWGYGKAVNCYKILPIFIVFLMALTLIMATLILILWLKSIGWSSLTIHKLNEISIEKKSPYDYLLRQNLKQVSDPFLKC